MTFCGHLGNVGLMGAFTKLEKEKQSGMFSTARDRSVFGELKLARSRTSLYLQDKEYFDTRNVPDRCITGVLHDLTRVSLINCITTSGTGHATRGDERYHFASIFPHFVIYGDCHLGPAEKRVLSVGFVMDDARVLFDDFRSFGTILDAGSIIEQVVQAGPLNTEIPIGSHAMVQYFAGRCEIAAVDTAVGKIGVSHNPIPSLGDSSGVALKNRVACVIDFGEALNFDEAVFRASMVIDFMGLLVGRPQNLVGPLQVQVLTESSNSSFLRVYWSMQPRRTPTHRSEKPHSFDILLDAVRNPDEFARVVKNWFDRQHDWHGARRRFFNSFAHQLSYDIDRLVGSANMFDILPKSAVPSDVPLTEELRSAQSAARKLFVDISKCPEQESVLSALGRIGRSSLKQKVRYRAQRVIDSAGEWFPELLMVTDEAINCRNYYVHGGEPKLDYDRNFNRVTFFTDTLEFVFAASDLAEAGWDIKAWISRGTSMSHPFGRYRANYPFALGDLKASLQL